MKKSETVELRKEIFELIVDRLSSNGFERKNGTRIIKKYNDEILHELFYSGNIDKEKKCVNVALDVNMRNVKIDKIVDKFYCYGVPWPSLNIGYLMPCKTYLEWEFVVGYDYTSQVEEIITSLIQYGIPYMESLSNTETMFDVLENHPYIGSVRKSYLLPLMYYLYRSKEMALNCMNDYILYYKKIFERFHNNDDCFWDIPSTPIEDKDSINYGIYVENLKKIMEEGRTLE